MWNNRLAARTCDYPTAVLSIVGAGGYPLSVRCVPRIDTTRQSFDFPTIPHYAASWRGKACLLFHRHNERLEDLHQVVVRGELIEENGLLTLQVNDFLTANGRNDTDAMPHAGAPLRMLQFFWLGRRKAHDYIAKRGAPWPPVPYDELNRALADVD